MTASGEGSGGNRRLAFVALLLASSALALVIRVGYLQIVQHETYREQARAEHWSRQPLLPQRGAILDRNGAPLALSVTSYRIALDPASFRTEEGRDRTVRRLAEVLRRPAEPLLARVAAAPPESRAPIPLLDEVPHQEGLAVQESGLLGLVVEETVRRSYPEGSLAAGLLGFIGKDGEGLTGLEADFNRDLGGVPGSMLFERDSLGDPIPFGYREVTPAVDGSNLVLTIDRYIQRMAEQRLEEAVTKHQAAGGIILVMEPYTGAVLAMASRPTYDLAALDLSRPPAQELFRNRAITDMYEPGSTFKVITMSAAINAGLVTPETKYYDGGPVNKGGWIINTWNGQHFGWQTMTQLLMTSNNIGTVWLTDQLGPERFYHYVRAFGFGQPTNIGLSGEASGQLRWPDSPGWGTIDLATNSFGQAINVTPLQMVTAVSAVVNGGVLMRPSVVQEVEGPQGTRTYEPVVVRRVISEQTSADLRLMMNAVAERGQARFGTVPGYHVGGKTGTAQVPRAGGYAPDATIASFVGFAPLEAPRFVALVRLDEPKDSPWGSTVAAPVFSALAQDIFTAWRIPPAALVKRTEP
ncbi:MAG: penicillin-binding protein 2 [Chloroflexi bacterium]|nr:penicillin-binding protein 2 [Chloroflexota bacterium]